MNDAIADGAGLRPAEPPSSAAARASDDRISELYHGKILPPETGEVARDRIHWICRQCRGKTVLDIGCSQGIATILLAREGFHVTGLDLRAEAIGFAREASSREPAEVRARITWIEASLAEFGCPEPFDTVILGEVLEQQALPARFLALAVQHVRPGGRVVVTTPFGLYPQPTHKSTLLPSDVLDMGMASRLRARRLDVVGGYTRARFVNRPGAQRRNGHDLTALLEKTERGVLQTQQDFHDQIRQKNDDLKKNSESERVLRQRLKLGEASLARLAAEHEQAVEARERVHAQELDKLDQSARAAKAEQQRQAAAHAQVVTELQQRHAQEAADLRQRVDAGEAERDRLAAGHARTVAALRQTGAQEAADLRRRFEANEAERQRLAENVAAAVLLPEQAHARLRQEIEAGKAQRQQLEALHTDAISALEQRRAQEVADLRRRLEAGEAERRRLVVEHDMAMASLQQTRAEETAAGRRRFESSEAERQRLEGEQAAALVREQARAQEAAGLRQQIDRGEAERRRLEDEHARTMAILDTVHAHEAAGLRGRVEAGEAERTRSAAEHAAALANLEQTGVRDAAEPRASKPELSDELRPLMEVYQAGGPAAVMSLLASDTKLVPRVRATRLLQLGKGLAEAGDRGAEVPLAELALTIDRSEPVLRNVFWAFQRHKHLEAACAIGQELERVIGSTPEGRQVEFLTRLRSSQAYLLSVLDLVLPKRQPPFRPFAGRLCYCLNNSLPYTSNGYAARSHGLAMGLAEIGYDAITLTRPGFPVDILPRLAATDIPAVDPVDSVRYVRITEPARTGRSAFDYLTLSADAIELRLKEIRPEVVIAASNHGIALPALIAARRTGLPFAYEVRGLWEITHASRERHFEQTTAFAAQRILEANVARHADHVFTLTEGLKDELVARGVPPEKISLLPNSCDPERFAPMPRDAQLAQRLGIPDGVPVIGYVGTFVQYEGLEDLAEACALVRDWGLDFRLLLVGNENVSGQGRGPISEQIASIATERGFADRLIMPGRVPHEEVERYYSLIDICPFPRKPLPVCEMVSPLKPIEALAMEKAVVVSSVRALAEMIDDGKTGVVFEKGSIDALAGALARLLIDPGRRERLGRAGREWVLRERTWRSTAQKAAEQLAKLTGRRPAPNGPETSKPDAPEDKADGGKQHTAATGIPAGGGLANGIVPPQAMPLSTADFGRVARE